MDLQGTTLQYNVKKICRLQSLFLHHCKQYDMIDHLVAPYTCMTENIQIFIYLNWSGSVILGNGVVTNMLDDLDFTHRFFCALY